MADTRDWLGPDGVLSRSAQLHVQYLRKEQAEFRAFCRVWRDRFTWRRQAIRMCIDEAQRIAEAKEAARG